MNGSRFQHLSQTRVKWLLLSTILLSSLLAGVQADFLNGMAALQQGNYALALQELEPLAEEGDTSIQFLLGSLYDRGWGIDQDYKIAARWYRRAAIRGDTRAQYKLAFLYAEGKGVAQDDINAHRWWHIAALQGHEMAASFRNSVEKKMTAAEIRKANLLALECAARNFSDC
jgi:TPR repeat protein